MDSRSSNSQNVSVKKSNSREQSQIENFKVGTGMKVFVVLLVLAVIGGGAYWFLYKKGKGGVSLGKGAVKSLTDSANL